jgi:phage baseplate assembly protein gpV
VHIHFKVRTASGLQFTSQLFFTDAMNDAVFAAGAAYKTRGSSPMKDGSDNIYGTDGASLLLNPTSDGSGGYAADFSVGISSGSSTPTSTTTTTDTAVDATLTSVKAVRTAAGSRRVRIKLKPSEPVAVTAKLTRSGRTLASKRVVLTAGAHTITVPLGGTAKAGAARLTLTLKDALLNAKTYHRTVHVPTRKRG